MNCEISAADSFSEKVMQHNIVSSQFPFDMIFFRKKRAEAGKNELKQEFHNMGNVCKPDLMHEVDHDC